MAVRKNATMTTARIASLMLRKIPAKTPRISKMEYPHQIIEKVFFCRLVQFGFKDLMAL